MAILTIDPTISPAVSGAAVPDAAVPEAVVSEAAVSSSPRTADGLSGCAVDVESVPLEVLEREICGWAGRIAAATCRMLLALAAFDRRGGWSGLGMGSCAHWLAWRCGLNVRTAQEQVAVAHALEELPAVRAAFAAGRLSYSKVRAVARVAEAETEQTWLTHALHCTAAQLERLAARYHQLTADPAAQGASRAVNWSVRSDGLFRLSAVLTAQEGARFAAAIDAARASLDDVSVPADGEPASADRGVIAAVRDRRADADALVVLADGFLNGPAPGLLDPAHTLTVHIDAGTLLAASDRPGEAELAGDPGVGRGATSAGEDSGGTATDEDESTRTGWPMDALSTATGTDPIGRLARGLLRCDAGPGIGLPQATLAQLGCDALIRALARDETGNPLALGRRRRVPTQRLREAVYTRDQGTCRYPGCAHTRWLHIHHLRAWLVDAGETSLENLTLVCTRHHQLIHDEGIRLRRRADGIVVAVLPDGFVVEPAPALDPGAQPADALAAATRHVAPDALRTRDGGRLSWDDSLYVLLQHRRPAAQAGLPATTMPFS